MKVTFGLSYLLPFFLTYFILAINETRLYKKGIISWDSFNNSLAMSIASLFCFIGLQIILTLI